MMAPQAGVLARFRRRARTLFFSSPLYGLTLGGGAPAALAVVPPDPWPGDAANGLALINGVFRFAGHTIQTESPLWQPAGAAPEWVAALHGFEWLRDLRAVGGDAARRQARMLVGSWIERHAAWDPVAWAPDVLGARVASWIGQHDFYCASADDAFRARVFESLARQMRHLARALPGDLQGVPMLTAIRGLAYGALALPGGEKRLRLALALLERELPVQVLADGVHVQRSPALHLAALRHLIDLRAALRAARVAVPDALQHAVDRMAPALRFFRLGDGGLALFNGGQECEPVTIDVALAQADARGRTLRSAPHGGFERLSAGRTLLLVDVGRAPPPGLDREAHAGTLAFEMCAGRERLIVNCGAHPGRLGAWRRALAATAAHSTATVADTNSAEVLEAGGLGRRPAQVSCERRESEGAVLLDAAHDGYRDSLGILHRRRLYLSEAEDLRGEDRFDGPEGRPFAVRFHLHPAVEPTLESEAGTASLRLPSGAVWRLRVTGGALTLGESIYLGRGDEPVRTAQLAIEGETRPGEDGATVVKWALRREPEEP